MTIQVYKWDQTLQASYASFAAWITAIDTAPVSIAIGIDVTIDTTLVIPANIDIVAFYNGAMVNIDAGCTLTVTTMSATPQYKWYYQAPTATIVLPNFSLKGRTVVDLAGNGDPNPFIRLAYNGASSQNQVLINRPTPQNNAASMDVLGEIDCSDMFAVVGSGLQRFKIHDTAQGTAGMWLLESGSGFGETGCLEISNGSTYPNTRVKVNASGNFGLGITGSPEGIMTIEKNTAGVTSKGFLFNVGNSTASTGTFTRSQNINLQDAGTLTDAGELDIIKETGYFGSWKGYGFVSAAEPGQLQSGASFILDNSCGSTILTVSTWGDFSLTDTNYKVCLLLTPETPTTPYVLTIKNRIGASVDLQYGLSISKALIPVLP